MIIQVADGYHIAVNVIKKDAPTEEAVRAFFKPMGDDFEEYVTITTVDPDNVVLLVGNNQDSNASVFKSITSILYLFSGQYSLKVQPQFLKR